MSNMDNEVRLTGNLGNDPQIAYLAGNKAVCNFRLATNQKFKAADGTTKEDTQWHTITCWNKRAEDASKFLTKGSKVTVKGRLQYREFVNKDGQKQRVAEIVADGVQYLSRAKEGSSQKEMNFSPPPEEPDLDLSSEDEIPY